jgi:benzylsuccinate CoA-transferase BbsF subunit
LRLARWADVVLESFTPGVLDDIGLGYAQLSSNNPALIMVSTGLLGQTGPDARGTSGVGTMGAAMSGATYLIGWPDRAPTGPFGPWTDSVTPRFIVASILAALHRRTRDGRGCYIDIAQADAGIQFVAPAFYESARNATIPERRSIAGSPLRPAQGVFPCASEDRWIAIDAPRTDRWTALRLVAEGALDEPAFDTLIGRMRRRAELDLAIADWTRPQEGAQLERRLQDHRVPAHIVSRGNDLAADPHLRASGYFRKIDDPVIGEAEIEPPRFTLARTPNPPTRRGPRIGEHTRDVLREILAMTDAEIDAITARGVLT